MHILFLLLLPIFDFQIHDIGVRGGIQGRELLGDTGNKRGAGLSILWCRVAGALRSSSRPGLTSRWPYLTMRCRTMICWTNLRNSAYETFGSNCRVANLKKMFNKFVQQIPKSQMGWLSSSGWIQVKYKSGRTIERCRICRYQKRDSSKPQRPQKIVCILKMECRIRDEAKINKYYAKTLLTSTFKSIHVRQPLNFTDWDPFLWPALR